MSYTPTTWTTGDTVTATKMNKLEQGVANAGSSAIVRFSATAYGSSSQTYGWFVYCVYDSTNSRWIVSEDNQTQWYWLIGYANEIPKIAPLEATILPNADDVGLFFVVNGNPTVSITGNISAVSQIYLSFGSVVAGQTYRITGNCTISLDNG